jgi:hypothetical protein
MQVFLLLIQTRLGLLCSEEYGEQLFSLLGDFDPILMHAFFWVAGSVDLAWISGAKPG